MKAPKLTIELVPSTAWGENLRKILKKEHWDILRKASYKRARYRCECCGGKGDCACKAAKEESSESKAE